MMMAPLQSTKPAAGVMDTRPATAPEMTDMSVGLPFTNHSVSIQDMPAAPVATCVVAIATPAYTLAPPALPALKPNQPTQSSEAPMSEMETLCGSKRELPWPWRLPRQMAHISALTPELRCTTPPPA